MRKNSTRGVLLAVGFVSLGLWGCSQSKTGADTAAKFRDLEARHAKLADDYQSLATANDAIRKRLTLVEAELAKQIEQLRLVTRERDDFKRQALARTGERDALRAHMVEFGKDLQNLLGRVEAATNTGSRPVTASLASFESN